MSWVSTAGWEPDCSCRGAFADIWPALAFDAEGSARRVCAKCGKDWKQCADMRPAMNRK